MPNPGGLRGHFPIMSGMVKKFSDLEFYEYVPQAVRSFWEEQNKRIIEGYQKRDLRPDINIIIDRWKKVYGIFRQVHGRKRYTLSRDDCRILST